MGSATWTLANEHISLAFMERREGERASIPESGKVTFGDLRRLTPISTNFFGFERGRPIDRYYIEKFLDQHADDVRGRVLEVQEDDYTTRFGGPCGQQE